MYFRIPVLPQKRCEEPKGDECIFDKQKWEFAEYYAPEIGLSSSDNQEKEYQDKLEGVCQHKSLNKVSPSPSPKSSPSSSPKSYSCPCPCSCSK